MTELRKYKAYMTRIGGWTTCWASCYAYDYETALNRFKATWGSHYIVEGVVEKNLSDEVADCLLQDCNHVPLGDPVSEDEMMTVSYYDGNKDEDVSD